MTKKSLDREKYWNLKKMYLETPVGLVEILEDGKGICSLGFGSSEEAASVPEEKTPLLSQAEKELREYFQRERRIFTLPLSYEGTPFQMRDWQALLSIPYGETRSYGDIARAIGCPKGFRAVGMANRCNPIAILIPCHRVIGADGSLTGYGGKNKFLNMKEYLLSLEGAI